MKREDFLRMRNSGVSLPAGQQYAGTQPDRHQAHNHSVATSTRMPDGRPGSCSHVAPVGSPVRKP